MNDLYEHRLVKVEEAVKTLSDAVDTLQDFATEMKVYFKVGGVLLLFVLGVVQPVVSHMLGG